MSNKLSQFWQELKRRNVVRVITVYAGAAFVIIELVDIVAPNLGLPSWTFNIVFILLLVGFVVTIVVSWIYDIHPKGGIVKTDPANKVKEEDIPKTSNGWKIASYVSFVVIISMTCVLLYPKIFNPDRLREMRNEEGIISLAVLPFENLTGDPSLQYWQNGISEYLINKLSASQELAVSSSHVIADVLGTVHEVNSASLSPDMARLTARKIDASTYITGKVIGRENDASIMLNLVNSENGEMIWTTSVNGNLGSDYRAVLDHLSDTVRNYMEIRALEDLAEPEMINAFPNSAEAYRNYINGLNAFLDVDYESAIVYLNKAYEIDTTFAFAAHYLAFAHNMVNAADENCNRWAKRAYELKNNLPTTYRPWIENWAALYITKDFNQIRSTADRMYEEAIDNRILWWDLATIYSLFLGDFPKAISAYERVEALNNKWDDEWKFDDYYKFYSMDLARADRPDEAIKIANAGLRMNPSNMWLVMYKGAAYIMLEDSINAQIQKKEIQRMMEENNSSEARAIHWIASMYWVAKDTIGALGYFRQAFEMNRMRRNSLAMVIQCQLRTNMNLAECYELIEYGIKTHPGRNLQFFWLKGVCLHKFGEHQEALEILKDVEDQYNMYNYQLHKDIQEVERSLELKRGSQQPG